MTRLKELCQKNGMMQKEIALSLGIAPSTFSQYSNGNREPDYDTLIRIADYFKVSVDYLLGRTNIKEMPESASLTTSEIEVLELFSSLQPPTQIQVLSYLRFLSQEDQVSSNQWLTPAEEQSIRDGFQESEIGHNNDSRKARG